MDLTIKKGDVSRAAQNLLNFLKNKNIQTAKDLDAFLDHEFILDINTKEEISILLRDSNLNTKAYTITDFIPQKGIPVEIKLNDQLGYSQIILRESLRIKS